MIGASQSNCFHLVPCVVRSAIACVIPPMPCLIPVFADQLSLSLSSLRGADLHTTVILMMEVADEATYVRHHPKKIAFLLSAMRHHAAALRAAGSRDFSAIHARNGTASAVPARASAAAVNAASIVSSGAFSSA